MEANLCLPTQHFPAMRHHKNVLVHSSVRLPALQAKIGPPPGSARVAVVGAGVVLACALGAMYWKRARALHLPVHRSSQTSHEGGNGGDHHPEGVIVKLEDLHDLLSKICIRELDPKLPKLTKLIDQCLTDKDAKNVIKNEDQTSLLEKKFLKTTPPGEDEYNLGLVLILALISEKKYAKAKEICNRLRDVPSQRDGSPDISLAIINMMMAMESMLQFPNTTSKSDLEKKLKAVGEAWERYEKNSVFQGGPPPITPP